MVTKTRYRVVIVEDHAIMRDGLRLLLGSYPGFMLVGEAGEGQEAIRVADKFQPDIVLLDLSMPGTNGIEVIKEIKRVSGQTRVLVLTAHKDEAHVFAALKAGANGYCLKDCGSVELLTALKTVMDGKRFLSPVITTQVLTAFLEGASGGGSSQGESVFDLLSVREREVLALVAEGWHTREIAAYLSLGPKTIEKHRSNLMKRLGLHSIAALTAYAIEKGLVTS